MAKKAVKKTAKKTAKKKVAKKTTKKKVAKTTTKKKEAKKATTNKVTEQQSEPLIVASKVKAFIKSQDKMTASETLEALNARLYKILECAVSRAEANGRKTIKAQDL